MEKLDYKKHFQEMRKKIEFNINTTQYDEAANNIRKVLEVICKYYIDKYKITLEEKKNSLHDMVFALEEFFSKERIQRYYDLKEIGNTGSHTSFNVSKEEAEWAYNILNDEIEKTLLDVYGSIDLLPDGFPSILDEGWKKYDNFSISGKIENGIYTEEIEGIAGLPAFLNDFYKDQDLPCMPVTVIKRTINGSDIEYETFFEYKKYSSTADKYVDILFFRDLDNNLINRFEVKDSEGKSVYLYDRFNRILEGEWINNFTKAKDLMEKSGVSEKRSLYSLANPQLLLSSLFDNEEFIPFRSYDSWIIPDNMGNYAVVRNSSVEVGDVIKEENGTPVFNLSAEIKYDFIAGNRFEENLKEKLSAIAEDFFKLHLIRNAIYVLLKKQELCDDYLDTKIMFIKDGEIAIPFLDGFELRIARHKKECVLKLFDNYKNDNYEFIISNNITVDDLEKVGNFKNGLGFRNREMGINTQIIEVILEADKTLYLSKEELQLDKDTIINAVIKAVKTGRVVEEISKKEKQYKNEKEKLVTQKQKTKKKTAGAVIGIILAIFIPLACILICVSPCVISSISEAIPKNIYLDDYCEVELTGYEGVGTVKVTLDKDFYEKYNGKIKYKYDASHPKDVSALQYFVDNCNYTMENNGHFRNGETIEIKWNIDDDFMLQTFNCKVKRKDIKYTVSGLESVDFFDAFENFEYNLEGVSQDANLVVESSLNSAGYNGLLYKADKTEKIKNGDTIIVSVVTETGEDIYDYCVNRFQKVPSELEFSIVVEGLPEYVTQYNQISQNFIDSVVKTGEERLREKLADASYINSMSFEYIGNYFLTSKNTDGENHNKLILIYKVKTQGKYSDYEFYEAYGAWDIYIDGDETKYIFYDDPNPVVYKDMWSDRYYGVENSNEIYNTFVSSNAESHDILNNMNE